MNQTMTKYVTLAHIHGYGGAIDTLNEVTTIAVPIMAMIAPFSRPKTCPMKMIADHTVTSVAKPTPMPANRRTPRYIAQTAVHNISFLKLN